MTWPRRPADDFGSEIQSHLQLEIDALRAQGMSEEGAHAAARRRFGNVTRAEEQFYDSSRWQWADTLLRNIRFGLRLMARNPGSSIVAVFVLALGIGANTAIFTLLNAVLLRSLPVQHPDELLLFGKGQWGGSIDDLPNRSWQLFSYKGYREFQSRNQVFSDVAAIDSLMLTTHGRVRRNGTLEKLDTELVSGNYFDTLGVKPALGRTLTAADDGAPGAHPVAVASYAWWQRRAPGIGATVTIGSTVYSIVGVAARGFAGMTVEQSPDLWIPLAMEKEISPGWNGLGDNLFQSLYVVARLKPGVSAQQASANVNLLFGQIARSYAGPQPTRKQLEDLSHAKVELSPVATGISQIRRQFFSPLMILMTVVGVVLLIACTNVANLLLARASVRQHEIAIRMSVGAPRSQLIHQLLIEGSLLGLTGAALGVAAAWGASRMLLAMVSTGHQPLPIDVAPDAHILGFTLLVTLLTVMLFGTLPAFRATCVDLAASLKEGRGVAGGPTRNRLSRGLIVGQVALSLALLSGAGLFLRSLVNLMNVDTGFDDRNALLTGIDAPAAGYKEDPRLQDMMQRVEQQVRAIPGVRSAAFAFSVFNGGEWTDTVTVPGRPSSDHDPEVHDNIVGAEYLSVMGIPITAGRGFQPDDTNASRKVAVINETMARAYFPGISPIGHTFANGSGKEWQDLEVVGVARDAKYMGVDERPKAAAFYPETQHTGFLNNLVVRYTGDAALVIPQIRHAVSAVDPNLPLSDFSTLKDVVSDSMARQRLLAQLSTLFGIVAALLACVGIYGVMSYGIARRTNEFGIRMALGANRAAVLWMVLRETVSLALIGVVVGVTLALACSRLVGSVLFGLGPSDPVTLGAATVLMIGVALFAGWLPARRATRIDPMLALRHE